MIYYHMTPRENKEAILREGLHSDQQIFLAKSEEDTFILAPGMGSYYCLYKYFKKKCEIPSIYAVLGTAKKLITVFEIDGSNLSVTPRRNGTTKFFESGYGLNLGENRTVYEYLTHYVSPQQILGFKDYVIPMPYISESSVTERYKKLKQMRQNGLSDEEIREAIISDFPPLCTPFNKDKFLENHAEKD